MYAVFKGSTLKGEYDSPFNIKDKDGGAILDATTWSEAELKERGVYVVTVAPEPDLTTKRLTRTVIKLVGEKAVQSYETVDLSAAEISQRLDLARNEAIASVNAAAESQRLRYITPGDGQAMTYLEKRQEASAVKAVVASSKAPKAEDYPHLKDEVGVTAATLEAVADVVLAKTKAWQAVSAKIESARKKAGKDIKSAHAAKNLAGIQAALAAVKWPE